MQPNQPTQQLLLHHEDFPYDPERNPTQNTDWPTPAMQPNQPTQQLLLQDEDFRYDAVGNPTEIRDWRIPGDWPTGAQPVTRKTKYDDLNRAIQVDHQYPAGTDPWTSPYAADSGSTLPSDSRRAVPNPHVSFSNRVLRQTFEYDWLGNTEKTTDDASGFYDRSLGPITQNGATNKPYQLKGATFAGTRGGTVNTLYDDAGNLTRLDLTRSGPCATSGQTCNHRYAYTWDEVGRLTRARRWNVTPTSDINADYSGNPFVDLRYYYDSSDSRTLKEAVDATSNRLFTAYIFPTLELRRARYGTAYNVGSSGNDYEIGTFTVVPYLIANGVRLGRLVYETLGLVPQVTPGTGATQTNVAVIQAHVYLELTDHLGSSSITLDKASSELVSRTSYMAYGTTDSDYRPTRWNSFREDYKFTGKEEDSEVGLTYFGKRFLNAQLGRWISADPLAVHAPGEADLNLYAYVSGTVLKAIDPLGLDKTSEVNGLGAEAYDNIQAALNTGQTAQPGGTSPAPVVSDEDKIADSVGVQRSPIQNGTFTNETLEKSRASLPENAQSDPTLKPTIGTGPTLSWTTERTGVFHGYSGTGEDLGIVGEKAIEPTVSPIDLAAGGIANGLRGTALRLPAAPKLNFGSAGASSEGVSLTLQNGTLMNRVWDSRSAPGLPYSGPLGQSYSPGAWLPTSAEVAIVDRGLNIPGVMNNARMGAVFEVTGSVPATLRTSLEGITPELVVAPQYLPQIRIIESTVSKLPSKP